MIKKEFRMLMVGDRVMFTAKGSEHGNIGTVLQIIDNELYVIGEAGTVWYDREKKSYLSTKQAHYCAWKFLNH